MTETYTLLINAGVAGVFAIFAIILIREFVKFLSAQNDLWRQYLESERKQRANAMDKAYTSLDSVGYNLAELTKQIAILTTLVQRMEDRSARQAGEELEHVSRAKKAGQE